jgi:hypothetical protein
MSLEFDDAAADGGVPHGRRFAPFLALALLVGLAAEGPGQEPAPPADLAALARRVRAGEPGEAELREIGTAMLSVGEPGARALFHLARAELAARGRSFARDLERLLRDHGRAAPALLARRLGRDGPPRVEQLRGDVLGRSRAPELDARTIVEEIDPRIAELRQLLTLGPDELHEAVPRLGEVAARLRTEAARLEVLFALQEEAERVLLRTDEGRRLVERYPLADDPRGHLQDLERGVERACRLAMPIGERDARVLAANDATVDGVEPEERRGIAALNEIRVLVGLPALAIDSALCTASRGHSEDMARLGFFSHTSPVPGKESFGQRAALAGTSASAENIARGQRDGDGAIRAWWYSPGHHRNMMSGARRVGLGQHGDHWTQMLGG